MSDGCTMELCHRTKWCQFRGPNGSCIGTNPTTQSAAGYAPFKPIKPLREGCPMKTCKSWDGCCFPINCGNSK